MIYLLKPIITFFTCFLFMSMPAQEGGTARFVFYNVENLFDIYDDSLTIDEEFTPEASKGWTANRYHDKLDRIAKTLTAAGEWNFPAFVGLCEVENRSVLQDLVEHRLLSAAGYGIIHRESPDSRGIDVALLYNPNIFSVLDSHWIPIIFDVDPEMQTREILYVKGIVFEKDTLHIFINHWPSRWGGVEGSQPKRLTVAKKLREYTDSLFLFCRNPNILIAGDLNDNPVDSSVHRILGAEKQFDGSRNILVNLMFPVYEKQNEGSLKYKSDWEVYDQLIVSSALLDTIALHVQDNRAYIFSAPFLLTDDEKYLGKKPFRTYAGPSYLGGFSDHLPVYLDLVK